MNRPLASAMEFLPGTGWVQAPSNVQPAVAADVECDVAVIGGGLGGMTAAIRLAQLGVDVVLLEADICGLGASGRNAGYVGNSIGSNQFILSRFYADRLPGLMRFANTAVDFTEGLLEEHQIECHYEKNGMLVTATTTRQLNSLRRSLKPGGRSRVLTSQEMGVPPAFIGGLRVRRGGTMNPGEFSLGLRASALASGVRVFERSPVRNIEDREDGVEIALDHGRVRAQRAVLTVNAFMSTLRIAPRRLSKPVRVTIVETEPLDDAEFDEAGWTSRLPLITSHLVLEGYRTTPQGTIVMSTRQMQVPRAPIGDRQPDQEIVADIVRGFRRRFPTLSHRDPVRTWGGWIGMTPSNLPVAGQVSARVFYSLACNGHGLPQAPYLGHLLAEHLAGCGMHDDLQAVWRDNPRFAPGIVNPLTLKLAWMTDRLEDGLDSKMSRRN